MALRGRLAEYMTYRCKGQMIDLSTVVQCPNASVVDGVVELSFEDRIVRIPVLLERNAITVSYRGRVYRFERESAGQSGAHHHASDGVMTSPMPCLVTKVCVKPGETVAKGQELLVLEAMKMVQSITAPFAGRVAKVNVTEGSMIQEGIAMVAVVAE